MIKEMFLVPLPKLPRLFLIDTRFTAEPVWCKSESDLWPNLWFSAFLRFLAGDIAIFLSLAALSLAALGDNFCLSLNGVPFILV